MASGVKDRAKRLKALGNAVDPLQALPILYGIRVLHDCLERGTYLDKAYRKEEKQKERVATPPPLTPPLCSGYSFL